ncbi:hypothetical protein RA281_28560, partial [Pseudomonas syringae pv. tagetis]
ERKQSRASVLSVSGAGLNGASCLHCDVDRHEMHYYAERGNENMLTPESRVGAERWHGSDETKKTTREPDLKLLGLFTLHF